MKGLIILAPTLMRGEDDVHVACRESDAIRISSFGILIVIHVLSRDGAILRFSFDGCSGDRVIAIDPATQIDQLAAIATEGKRRAVVERDGSEVFAANWASTLDHQDVPLDELPFEDALPLSLLPLSEPGIYEELSAVAAFF